MWETYVNRNINWNFTTNEVEEIPPAYVPKGSNSSSNEPESGGQFENSTYKLK
jgi:hypothetical protein